jgi:hypothetical protein
MNTAHQGEGPGDQMFRAVTAIVVLATQLASLPSHAQGSAGTGSTSTGIGPASGPAGPGIRRGGMTQQPGVATNRSTGTSSLSPTQKNAIPPRYAPANAQRSPQ